MQQGYGRGVKGFCPSCGNESLRVLHGEISCVEVTCKDPMAIFDILQDNELHHIVRLGRDGYLVRHPLYERASDELLACTVDKYVIAFHNGPLFAASGEGVYRLRLEPRTGSPIPDWTFLKKLETS